MKETRLNQDNIRKQITEANKHRFSKLPTNNKNVEPLKQHQRDYPQHLSSIS